MMQNYALHIGINQADTNGRDMNPKALLRYAHDDAQVMADISAANGFTNRRLLLDADATFENVVTEIRNAISHLAEGGMFLWSFSGHGTRFPGSEREHDPHDQGWILYDGILLDKCIRALLARFDKRARVVLVSDCCYGGNMVRHRRFAELWHRDHPDATLELGQLALKHVTVPSDVARPTTKTGPQYVGPCPEERVSLSDIQASVIAIGACSSDEVAFDGAFGRALRKVWEAPDSVLKERKGGYQELIGILNCHLPYTQTPTLTWYGSCDRRTLDEIPFGIPE